MTFERIVRPFQARTVAPAPVLPAPGSTTAAVPNVELKFGAVGETKTFNGSESHSMSTFCPTAVRETARETHTKRVENPDDPTQYVNVEVIDKLTTSENNGLKKTTTFKNDPP
jgi:hypothetical protein